MYKQPDDEFQLSEDDALEVEITERSMLHDDDDEFGAATVRKFHAKLFVEMSDGKRILLGNLSGFRIVASRDGVEAADSDSQELYDYATSMLDARGNWRAKVEKALGSFYGDLLVVHAVEIHPAARGQNLGHALVRRFLAQCGEGCGYVVLKAHPFMIDGPDSETADQARRRMAALKVGAKRLAGYWNKMGFAKWAGSGDYLGINLSLRLPDAIRSDVAQPAAPAAAMNSSLN